MCGLLNAQEGDYILWNIERTITKIYIPVLLDSCMGDKGTKDLLIKVKITKITLIKQIKCCCLGEKRTSAMPEVIHKFTKSC